MVQVGVMVGNDVVGSALGMMDGNDEILGIIESILVGKVDGIDDGDEDGDVHDGRNNAMAKLLESGSYFKRLAVWP